MYHRYFLIKNRCPGMKTKYSFKTVYPCHPSVLTKDKLNFPMVPNVTIPELFASCSLLINFEKSHIKKYKLPYETG
jgi:hypothetical protein